MQISQIIDDLECVTFVLDSSEEEAGRVVRELLQKSASASDSTEDSETKALQIAAVRLNITSPKAILIEKQSIKKLLGKIGPNEPKKKMILRHLLYFLKKYGNYIIREEMEKGCLYSDESVATDNSSHDSYRVIPPEEYECPISSKLMYDPVVIASGATYERMWIQKWFDEGHEFCPKTGKKLAHMLVTPNIALRDLISKWCRNNEVTIPDPGRRVETLNTWEASSTSIRSFDKASMNNLHLQMDFSNVSLGSVDSYSSDSSQSLTTHDINSMLMKTNVNSHSHQSHAHVDDVMLLSKFPDLQLDSQCQVIENLKICLKCNCQDFCSLSSENFIESLIKFLNNAYGLQDIKAMRAGTQLLLEFVNKCRYYYFFVILFSPCGSC